MNTFKLRDTCGHSEKHVSFVHLKIEEFELVLCVTNTSNFSTNSCFARLLYT